MSHIVNPQRSNLLLQILLEMNVYITGIWAACYPIDMFYNHCIMQLGMKLAYPLVLAIEWLRLYISFTINLCCRIPHPKMLLFTISVACAPLLLTLHYLSSKTCDQSHVMLIIWNLWYLCLVLQVLVIVGNSWWIRKLEQRI